jgi:hypothetical protein
MIPCRLRGLLVGLAALLAVPTGGGAQMPVRPQAPAGGQQRLGTRLGAPAQAPPAGTQPPAAAQPTQPQNAARTPQILGRRHPSYSPPPPRPQPQVSVSIVSPQGSNVFGRRTRVGGQQRGMTDAQRRTNPMGAGQ